MKKIGEYTTRGMTLNSVVTKINLFDGRFDTGYRVIRFVVLPNDTATAAGDVTGTLATEALAATANWDLGDQRQIAWSGQKMDAYVSTTNAGIVDPDNFIIEDLYFHGTSGTAGAVNYMITMEKYDTTEWMGALALVRNSGQDV